MSKERLSRYMYRTRRDSIAARAIDKTESRSEVVKPVSAEGAKVLIHGHTVLADGIEEGTAVLVADCYPGGMVRLSSIGAVRLAQMGDENFHISRVDGEEPFYFACETLLSLAGHPEVNCIEVRGLHVVANLGEYGIVSVAIGWHTTTLFRGDDLRIVTR